MLLVGAGEAAGAAARPQSVLLPVATHLTALVPRKHHAGQSLRKLSPPSSSSTSSPSEEGVRRQGFRAVAAAAP
jgi:hypothetical protein